MTYTTPAQTTTTATGAAITAANDVQTLAAKWLAWIDARPSTSATYTRAIMVYCDWLQAHGVTEPTRETVRQYRDDIASRLAPATVALYIVALRQLYSWSESVGLYVNIADHIKAPQTAATAAYKRDYLTADDVRSVLATVDRSTAAGKRNYALLVLMVVAGLRDIECSRANVGDISEVGGYPVLYVHGKGRDDKRDYVRLTDVVTCSLDKYLATRPDATPDAPLFASMSHNSEGSRLTTRSISRIVKAAYRATGSARLSDSRHTAHSLRHTAATLALLNGASLVETQQLLRHKSINTTMIYVHTLDQVRNTATSRVADAIFGAA